MVSYEFVKRKLDHGRSILHGTRKEKNMGTEKGIVNIEISHEERGSRSSSFIPSKIYIFLEASKDIKVISIIGRYSLKL